MPPARPRRGHHYLNFLEVDGLADELVVLGQLLARGQLDEHLAELPSTAAAKRHGASHGSAAAQPLPPPSSAWRSPRQRRGPRDVPLLPRLEPVGLNRPLQRGKCQRQPRAAREPRHKQQPPPWPPRKGQGGFLPGYSPGAAALAAQTPSTASLINSLLPAQAVPGAL